MLCGVAVLLRTEDDHHPQAIPPDDQGDSTIGSNTFNHIRLFNLKFDLFLQIPAQDGSFVLEHPSMMSFFAVQNQANAIEAVRTAAHGGSQLQCSFVGRIQAQAHSVVRKDLFDGLAGPAENFIDSGLTDRSVVDLQYRRIPLSCS